MTVKELLEHLKGWDPEAEVGFLTWREFDRDDSPRDNIDRQVNDVAPEMFYDKNGRNMFVMVGPNPHAQPAAKDPLAPDATRKMPCGCAWGTLLCPH